MLTGIIVINIFSTELGKWYQVQNFARLTIQNCPFLFLLWETVRVILEYIQRIKCNKKRRKMKINPALWGIAVTPGGNILLC